MDSEAYLVIIIIVNRSVIQKILEGSLETKKLLKKGTRSPYFNLKGIDMNKNSLWNRVNKYKFPSSPIERITALLYYTSLFLLFPLPFINLYIDLLIQQEGVVIVYIIAYPLFYVISGIVSFVVAMFFSLMVIMKEWIFDEDLSPGHMIEKVVINLGKLLSFPIRFLFYRLNLNLVKKKLIQQNDEKEKQRKLKEHTFRLLYDSDYREAYESLTNEENKEGRKTWM